MQDIDKKGSYNANVQILSRKKAGGRLTSKVKSRSDTRSRATFLEPATVSTAIGYTEYWFRFSREDEEIENGE